MKISIAVKYMGKEISIIAGQIDIKENDPVLQKVIECEQTLEQLTGLRFHIQGRWQ